LGKCKQRLIARAKNDKFQINVTRDEALKHAVKSLTKNPSSSSAKNMITLFGFSAEELAEAGLSYEVLRSLDFFLTK
jgi:ribosomal protein L13E